MERFTTKNSNVYKSVYSYWNYMYYILDRENCSELFVRIIKDENNKIRI